MRHRRIGDRPPKGLEQFAVLRDGGADMQTRRSEPSVHQMLGFASLNFRTVKVAEPAVISGVVPKLLLVAVIGVAELRIKMAGLTVGVPKLTVGVAEPPSLLKVKLTRVCVGPEL